MIWIIAYCITAYTGVFVCGLFQGLQQHVSVDDEDYNSVALFTVCFWCAPVVVIVAVFAVLIFFPAWIAGKVYRWRNP